jgi:hypothetical protein
MEVHLMLMLYQFNVEVFDLGLEYSYATHCTVIADTHEDRSHLLRHQFGAHNKSVLKRSVLLGARSLTCSEIDLLEVSVETDVSIWLTTRLRSETSDLQVRHLPRLQSEEDMYELLERAPECYDSIPLMMDQYMYSKCFCKCHSTAVDIRAAA